MSKKTRRSFTKEYKAEVVGLIIRNSGKSVGTICRDLDHTETAVGGSRRRRPCRTPIEQTRLRNLRRLEGARWLGFPPERGQPDSFGHVLERTLTGAGFEDPSFMAVDSLTAQKRLVEAGLGIALMPRSSVREELRLGSLRAITIDGLCSKLPVVAVRRRGAYERAATSAFIGLVRECTPGLRS
jgi:DNA-binding transcriptional LysR family regulator